MGEFSWNNADLEITSMFPIFANYGYHPRRQADQSLAKEPEDAQAQTLVKTLKELKDVLRSEMAWAQEFQQEIANR